MHNHYQYIPDQSWPRLPMTASGVTQQGTYGYYATARHSENKRREEKGK